MDLRGFCYTPRLVRSEAAYAIRALRFEGSFSRESSIRATVLTKPSVPS